MTTQLEYECPICKEISTHYIDSCGDYIEKNKACDCVEWEGCGWCVKDESLADVIIELEAAKNKLAEGYGYCVKLESEIALFRKMWELYISDKYSFQDFNSNVAWVMTKLFTHNGNPTEIMKEIIEGVK